MCSVSKAQQPPAPGQSPAAPSVACPRFFPPDTTTSLYPRNTTASEKTAYVAKPTRIPQAVAMFDMMKGNTNAPTPPPVEANAIAAPFAMVEQGDSEPSQQQSTPEQGNHERASRRTRSERGDKILGYPVGDAHLDTDIEKQGKEAKPVRRMRVQGTAAACCMVTRIPAESSKRQEHDQGKYPDEQNRHAAVYECPRQVFTDEDSYHEGSGKRTD